MPTILVTVDGAFQPVPSSTRLRAAVASEAPPNGTLLLGPTAIPECGPVDRLFVDPLTGHRASWFSRPGPLVECLRDIHATAKLIRSGPVRSSLPNGRDSIATRHPPLSPYRSLAFPDQVSPTQGVLLRVFLWRRLLATTPVSPAVCAQVARAREGSNSGSLRQVRRFQGPVVASQCVAAAPARVRIPSGRSCFT